MSPCPLHLAELAESLEDICKIFPLPELPGDHRRGHQEDQEVGPVCGDETLESGQHHGDALSILSVTSL